MKNKRIGVFSGTFDPVHFGHIEACRSAMEKCSLDRVYMLLEKSPRRKQKTAPAEQRFEMMELATKETPSIIPVDIGVDNITTSNVLDFLKQYNADSEYWYIFGSDILDHIDSWEDIEKLLNNFHLCVVLRDNSDRKNVAHQLSSMTDSYGARFEILPTVWSNVSSTIAKNALPNAEDFLDPNVQRYIIRNNLYSKASSK